MSVRLHRIFWPVGHGAFYTEEFYVDDVNKFTIVYDCGGKNISNSIKNFIGENNSKDSKTTTKKQIDLLFISHFHHDHINGVIELINKTDVKRILIPQLTQLMLAEAYIYNTLLFWDNNQNITNEREIYSTQAFIMSLVAYKWNFVDENLGFDTKSLKDLITEVVPNQTNVEEKRGLDIQNRSSNQDPIGSGNSIIIKLYEVTSDEDFIWKYIPVNLDYDCRFAKDLIAILEKEIGAKVYTNRTINWSLLCDAISNDDVIKAIKKTYQKKYKTHNSYSMPVFSGPANYPFNHRCDIIVRSAEVGMFMNIKAALGRSILSLDSSLFSCLYMGDFEASKQAKVECLQKILGPNYCSVGLQQIPHHFSKNNHNINLYRGRIMAFGNVSNNDRSFYPEVAGDISFSGSQPIVIKEKNGFHLHYSIF